MFLPNRPLQLEVLGETIDDAAGEAFDKSAKLLGLPYPGGPLIDKWAKEGNGARFSFAEPQIADLNFSFSGLKTSVLYFLQKQTALNPDFIDENKADLCASIQQTIINILLKKVKKAVEQTNIQSVCLAGGVSANSGLRNALIRMGEKLNWQTFIPQFQYCTDNAAMIAIAAYYKYLASIILLSFLHRQLHVQDGECYVRCEMYDVQCNDKHVKTSYIPHLHF